MVPRIKIYCLSKLVDNDDKDKSFTLYIYRDIVGMMLQGYLNSEVVLGRLLQGKRRDVIVATKFGVRVPIYSASDIDQSVTNSLARLQTDYIDLYQVSGYKQITLTSTR